MTIHLGRLKKVDLREFFKDEASDFTPWLGQKKTLNYSEKLLDLI